MQLRSLPRIVRPQYHESELVGSFARRIETWTGSALGLLTNIARDLSDPKDNHVVLASLTTIAEQLTALEPGDIDVVAPDDNSQHMGARLLCLDCADGEDVELLPHEDYHCCLTHRRWTGPEQAPTRRSSLGKYQIPQREPWSSAALGDPVLRADETYRSLRAENRASIQLLRELVDVVDQNDGVETAGIPTPANYATVVSLMALVTDPKLHVELFDPTITYAVARGFLNDMIDRAVPGASENLKEQVWFLLRPGFLAVREQLQGFTPGSTGVIDIDVDSIVTGRTVMQPFEPFSRALPHTDQLEWARWCQRHLLAGQSVTVRRKIRQGANSLEFICDHGHRYHAAPNTIYKAVQLGGSGCPYCSGRSALSGYNSMAETHPRLAAQWHPNLNEDITPSQIKGAGNSKKYWWQCDQDHAWQESPNNRSKGRGCPYCSGRRVVEGKTSLDVTHPDIAQEWDFTANGDLKPEYIQAGSGNKVAWICPRKHSYTATVGSRTGRGAGCPVCANLRVLSGFNDLATTHPQIASEWDFERNGTIRPNDVVAGSKVKRHWVCRYGHSYSSAAVTRVAGQGCSVCANKQVLAGFNDLVTMNAAVAKEWHPTLNNKLSPAMVTAGSGKKVKWLCPLNHVYQQVVAKRAAGSGCPICANKKVLPGFNDIATRYPGIASDWHPTKNAPLLATEILPGNSRRWWLCQNDHEQYSTVPNRLKTRGCSACPPHERAGADPAE